MPSATAACWARSGKNGRHRRQPLYAAYGAVCERLAKNVMQSATRHAARFEARAKMEAERSATYLTMDSRKVIPEIFDRQQAEQHAKLDQVASYSDGDNFDQNDSVRDFRINIENPYAKSEDKLFYKKVGARPEEDQARDQIQRSPNTSRNYSACCCLFAASAVNTRFAVWQRSDWGRNGDARLSRLYPCRFCNAHTQALAIKQRKRAFLEANGWMAVLSSQEREEMRQRSRTAQLRGHTYQDLAQRAATAGLALSGSQADLHRRDRAGKIEKLRQAQTCLWECALAATRITQPVFVAFHRSMNWLLGPAWAMLRWMRSIGSASCTPAQSMSAGA